MNEPDRADVDPADRREATGAAVAPAVDGTLPPAPLPGARRVRRRLPPVLRLGLVAVLGVAAGLLMSYLLRRLGY